MFLFVFFCILFVTDFINKKAEIVFTGQTRVKAAYNFAKNGFWRRKYYKKKKFKSISYLKCIQPDHSHEGVQNVLKPTVFVLQTKKKKKGGIGWGNIFINVCALQWECQVTLIPILIH